MYSKCFKQNSLEIDLSILFPLRLIRKKLKETIQKKIFWLIKMFDD